MLKGRALKPDSSKCIGCRSKISWCRRPSGELWVTARTGGGVPDEKSLAVDGSSGRVVDLRAAWS